MRLPQGSPPGLLGISRGFPQISLAPLLLPPAGHCLHCVVPLGHCPGRVLRLSCGTQAMSLVPLPCRVFSEIAIWPLFVAHFFIRSRQEFHGIWAETSPRNFSSQFSFSPLPHHRDFWGSSFFLAQSSVPLKLLNPSRNRLLSSQFARLTQTCPYLGVDRLGLTTRDEVLLTHSERSGF